MALPNPSPSLKSLLAHSEWLAGLAKRLAVDGAAADDLVQDTWVAALRNPPRQEHSLRAWLARVARRMARVQGRLRGRELELDQAEAPPTDEVVARIEQERLLAKLVLELEEPYRKVVLQRFYGGLSAARIASLEGIPDATVRTRLRRALALLRERMERENGIDPRAWPLASLLLVPETSTIHAAHHGVLLMSTKSIVAVSLASGVLCALVVTEGILPRLGERKSSAVAPIVAADSADVADRAAGSRADVEGLDSPGLAAAARTKVAPEGDAFLSLAELRTLLASSSRLDQVRAIDLLLKKGSLEANQVLLDALITAQDPILLALLEEGLLSSPLDMSAAVMAVFDASKDPKALARLSGMLAKLAVKHPELQRDVAK
ncbi:MAG TPA: RNA polymerase sigma factor, partial [Planctomycetota bacterium]|nr:RNA polymerase sigma factor [Planctomycetota bacterium]